MQHIKHYSYASYYRAAHEVLLACSAQNIAHIQYMKVDLHAAHFMSHACFNVSHDKIEEHIRVHRTWVSA